MSATRIVRAVSFALVFGAAATSTHAAYFSGTGLTGWSVITGVSVAGLVLVFSGSNR